VQEALKLCSTSHIQDHGPEERGIDQVDMPDKSDIRLSPYPSFQAVGIGNIPDIRHWPL